MTYAYVSLLFGNPKYAPGALAIGYMLKEELKQPHDLVLMVTPDIADSDIASLTRYWKIRRVQYIRADHIVDPAIPAHRSYYGLVCTKFNLLTLTEYDKVLFIDLSYLPLSGRIDQLFRLPTPAMAYVPQMLERDWDSLEPGKPIPEEQSLNVNACLMLFTPSLAEYSRLLYALATYKGPHFGWPEQQFLGHAYAGQITLIDPVYYCNRHRPLCDKDRCVGIKFLRSTKPWDLSSDELEECDRIWHSVRDRMGGT
jgi:alpha-N-acetylglucosamine transferase